MRNENSYKPQLVRSLISKVSPKTYVLMEITIIIPNESMIILIKTIMYEVEFLLRVTQESRRKVNKFGEDKPMRWV